MNQWNKKNALWMVLYAVLYAVLTYLSCALGIIHPIFFVIYQISATITTVRSEYRTVHREPLDRRFQIG